MNIIYLTANVLGDAGANAAELFPVLAFKNKKVNNVFVADYGKNKELIKNKLFLPYIKLRFGYHRTFSNLFNAS